LKNPLVYLVEGEPNKGLKNTKDRGGKFPRNRRDLVENPTITLGELVATRREVEKI
jgi:hypothetical protein